MSGPEREESTTVRHEEEATFGKERETGHLRFQKHVEDRVADSDFVRRIESSAGTERAPPNENDSGEVETLPDGSISIPLLEEEFEIVKKVVVRERLVVRKQVEEKTEHVQVPLKAERLEVVENPADQ